jgi:hypothetical protein
MRKPPSRSSGLLILGVILIPAGIAMWSGGMERGYAGGGSWTSTVSTLGLLMIPGGFLAKAIIGAYVSGKRCESIPIWYWSDFALLAVLAAVMAVRLAS